MTEKEAYGQAFENGRAVGYEEGKRDAVKHGRWVRGHDLCCCSVCNFEIETGVDFNYCPNCGAKMDGDGNGS